MQRDCHYYSTLALAVRAGYTPEEARIIAFANYMTDCTSLTQVKYPWQLWGKRNPGPFFHFVDRDRIWLYLCKLLDFTGGQGNLCEGENDTWWLIRLGIALHAYQDTYSHAGFTGRMDKRNVMGLTKGYWFMPPYGHAQMLEIPDRAEAEWWDTRTGKLNRNPNIFAHALNEVYQLIMKPNSPLPAADITNIPLLEPDYDKRKAKWARLAGMPEIRFSAIKAEYWDKYGKEFRAAAKRQRDFLR